MFSQSPISVVRLVSVVVYQPNSDLLLERFDMYDPLSPIRCAICVCPFALKVAPTDVHCSNPAPTLHAYVPLSRQSLFNVRLTSPR